MAQQKIKKPLYPSHSDADSVADTELVGSQGLIKELGTKIFWCGDDHLHLTHPNYSSVGCCVTHIVGLPRHPATQLEMPLTPFQVDTFQQILKAVTNPGSMSDEDWKRLAHMFHILKGRQMGFTEIILRIIQFFCFTRYAGKNVGIIAATNGSLANKDLRRFYRLFHNIPGVTLGPPKAHKVELINGTVIEAFPASEEAMTGDTNYACIFMDESAKWKLVDDTPVFNSVMPIVRMNGADFFLISTPKGPLKMFYKIWKDPQEFVMLVYDIWEADGNLYTHDQIVEMLKTTKEDPNQEYLCKFTIGQHSILGAVTEEDLGKFKEWGDYPDEESDSYKEPDDGLEGQDDF